MNWGLRLEKWHTKCNKLYRKPHVLWFGATTLQQCQNGVGEMIQSTRQGTNFGFVPWASDFVNSQWRCSLYASVARLECGFCRTLVEKVWVYRIWAYSRVPGHRNWQIETAAWNLAGFLYCAWARGKRRGFRPGAAARHSQHAWVYTEFPQKHNFFFIFHFWSSARTLFLMGTVALCRVCSTGLR